MSDWEQMQLTDGATAPAHRRTDGAPAREAGALGGRANRKREVIHALGGLGMATDEMIAHHISRDKGPTAKRRLDLVREGYVQPVIEDGEHVRWETRSGVAAWVWTLTDKGRAAYYREARRAAYYREDHSAE